MLIIYQEDSIARLSEIVSLNYKIFKSMYKTEPYSFEQYQEKLKNKKPIIYIAISNKKIIGDAIAFENQGNYYIWILGIKEEFRDKGIASELLELHELHAKQQKFKKITIKVYGISQTMLLILKKRGYQIEKEKKSNNPKFKIYYLGLEL